MLILVTGGSGSGKSEFAESLVQKLHREPYLYLATMYPYDEECRQRIARHRKMRAAKHFDTLERYTNLATAALCPPAPLRAYGTVLLECMSNLAANELYQPDGAGERTVQAILDGLCHVRSQCDHLIVVSNEIFSDGIDYDEETKRYQRCLGEINRRVAAKADLSIEVVYSIPLVHKGRLEGDLAG